MDPVDYKHRSVDENGNPDDMFTEKEALSIAKEQGITFVDHYLIRKSDGTDYIDPVVEKDKELLNVPLRFDSHDEADAFAKKAKLKNYSVTQVRERA